MASPFHEATHAFVVPGDYGSIIDVVVNDTQRSYHKNETLEEIRKRYPNAIVMKFSEWTAQKAAIQDRPVVWTKCDEDRYMEMLEVLPPRVQSDFGFLVGEPADHHAGSNLPRYAAFVHVRGEHFESSRPMTIKEFRDFNLTKMQMK